jgi:hypothetical protein
VVPDNEPVEIEVLTVPANRRNPVGEFDKVPVVGVEPTLELFLGQPPLPVGIHRLGYMADVSTTLRRICE